MKYCYKKTEEGEEHGSYDGFKICPTCEEENARFAPKCPVCKTDIYVVPYRVYLGHGKETEYMCTEDKVWFLPSSKMIKDIEATGKEYLADKHPEFIERD